MSDAGRGPWICTHSGGKFFLRDPRPEDVRVEDVAHGLSRVNRFYGHTDGEPYSVAQHCVLASLIPRDPADQLAVLLHDASEAYLGDVISPVKKLLGRAYLALEERVMAAVHARFGVRCDPGTELVVRRCDRVLLATEVRDLAPWQELNEPPGDAPLQVVIVPWPWGEARAMFLERFGELYGGRPK